MPNTKESIPANPGPDFALRQSDAEEMQRALKGATTSRAAGMAHQTAEKALAPAGAKPAGSIFTPDKSENYSIRDRAPQDR